MAKLPSKNAKAAFGAGCFWHVQLEFSETKGVLKALAGYMGGNLKNPGYWDVATGKTGHAETVMMEYDPKIISYDKLVEMFFTMHDPTQKNRQGPDVGSEYRSVIFYYTEEQKRIATMIKMRVQRKLKSKMVTTQIVKATTFYPAEEYHQDFLKKRGRTTCNI